MAKAVCNIAIYIHLLFAPTGNFAPPDVPWIFDQLGFTNATESIPRILHEGLIDTLERLLRM